MSSSYQSTAWPPADPARTGATGYIGGDFLHAITETHPELEITALIRQRSATAKFKERYPHVRIVQGDLDDDELLVKAGATSDVIISQSPCTGGSKRHY